MPPKEVVELFATAYGPTVMALRAAGEEGRCTLLASLEELWTEHNVATDGTTLVWSEYLEVIGRVA
jgi:hypothetical protein